jgi:Flp pilus assembly protein TadB
MICHAIRMWLLNLTAMSVTAWAMTAFALFILYADRVSAAVYALVGLWAAAVPIPITVTLIRWWQRVRVARRVRHLAEEHKRLFETMCGEISSGVR